MRLLTLASFVVLAALGLWIGDSAHRVRLRDQVVERIELNGGSVVWIDAHSPQRDAPGGQLPWLWRAWGARPVAWLLVPPRGFGEAEIERLARLFPEARVAPVATPPRGEHP